MKRKLESIARQLSENEIKELMRLKKTGDKKTIALQKKRDKIAAQLADIDAQLAALLGEAPAAAPRRGRPAKKAGAAKTAAGARKTGKRRAGKGGRTNLSAAVREVFARAGGPLKAREVVAALPEAGIKVKNEADMRKRISVVLASQKNHFEQVSRGVYQLKTE